MEIYYGAKYGAIYSSLSLIFYIVFYMYIIIALFNITLAILANVFSIVVTLLIIIKKILGSNNYHVQYCFKLQIVVKSESIMHRQKSVETKTL